MTGLISLQSKGLSRVFSNTTVQKHQFLGAQLSLQSNSHIHTWLLEKTIALTRWTFVSLFNLKEPQEQRTMSLGDWVLYFFNRKSADSWFLCLKPEVLAIIVSSRQVPLLSPLYGPPTICNSGSEHKQVLQDHQWVCTGVPYHQGESFAAETETSQPQREKQDPGEDDHWCKFHEVSFFMSFILNVWSTVEPLHSLEAALFSSCDCEKNAPLLKGALKLSLYNFSENLKYNEFQTRM